jgi:glycosyltransferase involved in cell wall biosynthesis
MGKPLVSICIPTFNGEKYIEEAIKSALNQTYRDIEIIITDDNSQDRTLDIARSFVKNSNIPIYIYLHQPAGIGENWNYCVKMSNGEYIKFLFQDDLLEPGCIEEMISGVVGCINTGLVFCRRKIIYNKANPAHNVWVKEFNELHKSWENLRSFQNGKVLLKDKSILESPRNKIGEPTAVLLNKKVFEKVGYFNSKLRQALDYEFWYRVLTKFNVVFVDQALVSLRLHDEQATAINAKNHIEDYIEYPKLLYKNCFFSLNRKVQIDLFIKYNPIGRFIKKING